MHGIPPANRAFPAASCIPLVQSYTRDTFLFIFLVLTIVAFSYTLKQHRSLLLHRTQTEEWKGWMQVRKALLAVPRPPPVAVNAAAAADPHCCFMEMFGN